MPYVDGYLIPVPKKKLAAYKRMARLGSKVWKDHGALQYFECVADDLRTPCGKSFPAGIRAKPRETVVLAWIVYKSRAHRDKTNAAVMSDPRLGKMMEKGGMPFDMKRMIFSGFKVLVEA